MGLTLSSLFGRLFGKKQVRILMGKINKVKCNFIHFMFLFIFFFSRIRRSW